MLLLQSERHGVQAHHNHIHNHYHYHTTDGHLVQLQMQIPKREMRGCVRDNTELRLAYRKGAHRSTSFCHFLIPLLPLRRRHRLRPHRRRRSQR